MATQLHFFVSCFVTEKEVKKTGNRYLHHTILSYPYPTLPPHPLHTHPVMAESGTEISPRESCQQHDVLRVCREKT